MIVKYLRVSTAKQDIARQDIHNLSFWDKIKLLFNNFYS
ncbi:hypothetical protein Q604_UNBc4C00288G0001, partial [human gut metagenome]